MSGLEWIAWAAFLFGAALWPMGFDMYEDESSEAPKVLSIAGGLWVASAVLCGLSGAA